MLIIWRLHNPCFLSYCSTVPPSSRPSHHCLLVRDQQVESAGTEPVFAGTRTSLWMVTTLRTVKDLMWNMAPALAPCLWKNTRKWHNRDLDPHAFPYNVLRRPNHCLNPAFVPVFLCRIKVNLSYLKQIINTQVSLQVVLYIFGCLEGKIALIGTLGRCASK